MFPTQRVVKQNEATEEFAVFPCLHSVWCAHVALSVYHTSCVVGRSVGLSDIYLLGRILDSTTENNLVMWFAAAGVRRQSHSEPAHFRVALTLQNTRQESVSVTPPFGTLC